jgi:hypothetical protein
VDVGQGWLIFGLPPAEVAVHPAEKNDVQEFYLMCADVEAFVGALAERGVACGPVRDMGWGLLTQVSLPGGGKLGVYQACHARPPQARVKVARARTAKKAAARRPPARRPAKARPAARAKSKRR